MNKSVLLAVAAFGGLLLIALLLPNSDNKPTEGATSPAAEITTPTLPDSVAANFPTYPGAEVIKFAETSDAAGKIFYTISLGSRDSKEDINQWYREALSQDGWIIKSDKNVAGYQIIQSDKDNLYTSMQAASGENDSMTISQQAHIKP